MPFQSNQFVSTVGSGGGLGQEFVFCLTIRPNLLMMGGGGGTLDDGGMLDGVRLREVGKEWHDRCDEEEMK